MRLEEFFLFFTPHFIVHAVFVAPTLPFQIVIEQSIGLLLQLGPVVIVLFGESTGTDCLFGCPHVNAVAQNAGLDFQLE